MCSVWQQRVWAETAEAQPRKQNLILLPCLLLPADLLEDHGTSACPAAASTTDGGSSGATAASRGHRGCCLRTRSPIWHPHQLEFDSQRPSQSAPSAISSLRAPTRQLSNRHRFPSSWCWNPCCIWKRGLKHRHSPWQLHRMAGLQIQCSCTLRPTRLPFRRGSRPSRLARTRRSPWTSRDARAAWLPWSVWRERSHWADRVARAPRPNRPRQCSNVGEICLHPHHCFTIVRRSPLSTLPNW